MKTLFAIAGGLLLLSLGACSSGSDPQNDGNIAAGTSQDKSVFSGYVKDVKKAKQVQDKLSAAQKKMRAQIEKAESGNGGG